ncbi:hypothetical protein JAAARDRAFT_39800 [Jaapia argillacea MUCL 33604]|uniref:Uncharacterized protein n=1 Tax=Jaapia argillacea MUCL 33604 TaxID=933084 RepID=A0A067PD27_9AGAM|nr:hypothetical protein JAAARDRAFT_39800 [Jaapia argillacea MUCL 33604]
MPSILCGGPPEVLSLYLSSPLPLPVLESLKSDFALGAHDQYNPLVKLVVSDRTDLYGCSAEDVMRRLQDEAGSAGEDPGNVPPFLLADEETGEEGSVIYVERWATRDDFADGDLVEGEDWPEDEEGPLPFTIKLRVYMHYAPVLWANISICNIEIPEFYEYPFDPSAPLPPPTDGGCDWRKEPPGHAYVCASPASYEVSEDPEYTSQFMPRPENVYRLKPEVAERLNLVPHWAVGWDSRREVPEGSKEFAQEWKWEGCSC